MELQYATPRVVRSRPGFYWIALFCGIAPLSAGLASFGLWLLTGFGVLPLVGLLLIPVGCVCFLIGSACLIAYVVNQRAVFHTFTWPLLKRATIAALFLLINFPAAYACVKASDLFVGTSLVRVVNQSSTTINSFIFDGPNERHQFGPLAPGQTTSYRFQGDSELPYGMYEMNQSGKDLKGSITMNPSMTAIDCYRIIVTDKGTTVTKSWHAW